jgi:exodeoxyribonuclease VII large subunit
MNEQLKLSELNGLVKKAIGEAFTAPIWVIGEISELKLNRNGHCYLVLIEKDENGDTIVAQAKATIWSYSYRMLRPYFETTTGQQLTEGLKVLVSVSVEFHELYGYSLNIRDIDPTYTLGDMARRRREIIARLHAEGVAEMNKELLLPLVPQKIAVISSPTAAGYQDFIDQLINNPAGYHFHIKLFPAIMQGNETEESIINALEQIFLYERFFDAVVIIRGGGSQADLSCFDNYNLAYYITQFPLPVITGIGHEKDDSIVDLVAHTRLKTPTAVAEFLISGVTQFDMHMDDLSNRFLGRIEEIIQEKKNSIENFTRRLAPVMREKFLRVNSILNQTIWKLDNIVKKTIQHKVVQLEKREEIVRHEFKKIIADSRHYLDMAQQKASLTDPNIILARGYSITTYNGRALKNPDLLENNALIITRLFKGNITSEVKTIKKEN